MAPLTSTCVQTLLELTRNTETIYFYIVMIRNDNIYPYVYVFYLEGLEVRLLRLHLVRPSLQVDQVGQVDLIGKLELIPGQVNLIPGNVHLILGHMEQMGQVDL